MALYADLVTEWQKTNGDLVFSVSRMESQFQEAQQQAEQHNRDQSHNKDDNSTIEHTR